MHLTKCFGTKEEFTMLWRTILVLAALIAVLGTIGLIQRKRKADRAESADEAVEKTENNVVDLNDQFNRARYMEQDKA